MKDQKYYDEFLMPRTPLGTRCVHGLLRGGVRTREEVLGMTDGELMALPLIGERAVSMIRERIGPRPPRRSAVPTRRGRSWRVLAP